MPGQRGRKDPSGQRWIADGKRCALGNQRGRIVAWGCATANIHNSAFHPLAAHDADRSVVRADGNFHWQADDPGNLHRCARGGDWPQRIRIETVFSLLTRACHLKRASHHTWPASQARLAFTAAVFNLLADGDELYVGAQGRTHLALARFSR